MKNNEIDNTIIYLSKNLFYNIFMELDSWSLINITGIDRKEYLNNQFTIDMNVISKHQYKVGAHCNINGKVWTSFFIFKYYDCYLYIIRSSVYKKHIYELKKYSLFSKIDISKEINFVIFGLLGPDSLLIIERFFLKKFNKNQSLIISKKTIILKINKPINRFLIIIHKSELFSFLKFIKQHAIYRDSKQWLGLDIESYFPIIDNEISGRFILQSLGLKEWNAIDFNKGCYYGQEILCKYENKKINQFIVCSLIGENCLYNLKISENIDYFDNQTGNVYHVGIILAWVPIFDKKILLQIRMKKRFFKYKNIFFLSSDPDIKFRIFEC
ncbi:tRNA-modifying protein YgfZ [Buchnera aphidicola (Cinara kochiana kochiana)]|uniref:tRNA-modifying protein YgfZ n=1 Tax=Buchnera aphidicola (Cinara kochiana kochiana) TaxID=2518976 RepID=A0A451D5U7_9GAMM|nr:tRNA-modifying protein YgfZ [Buchnera aphidicola]VFP81182.1 tRNA-modifying protein YgfZ [Buchnera aphidicola (Cinara kochiana kochiana)]